MHLADLKALEQLELSGTRITDYGLEFLTELTNLRQLGLQDTEITDIGVDCLKGLTKLEQLSLSRTQTTDAGLESLKGLTNLKAVGSSGHTHHRHRFGVAEGSDEAGAIDLEDTQVTDAGLIHLKDLTELTNPARLDLTDTLVTHAGLRTPSGIRDGFADVLNHLGVAIHRCHSVIRILPPNGTYGKDDENVSCSVASCRTYSTMELPSTTRSISTSRGPIQPTPNRIANQFCSFVIQMRGRSSHDGWIAVSHYAGSSHNFTPDVPISIRDVTDGAATRSWLARSERDTKRGVIQQTFVIQRMASVSVTTLSVVMETLRARIC